MVLSKLMFPVVGAVAAWTAWTTGEILLPPMIEGSGVYTGGEAVTPGQTVPVDWTITKRTDCPGLTSRAWFGQDGFQLTEVAQTTALPEGENMHYSVQTGIPALAPAGVLELHITGYFECEGKSPMRFDLGPVLFKVERD